jgi:DME family drug/metabolite transporter
VDKRGIALILAGAALWGTTGTAQALAPASAQPAQVGALRLLAGGVFLLLYFVSAGGRPRIDRRDVAALLVAGACMAAYQLLFFAGVKMTGVAVGTVVGIGSSPVIAGLLGWLFRGERPGGRWAAATALAVCGAALLAFSGGAEFHVSLPGMLLAAGAGAAYATFSLASKGLLERQPVSLVMAVSFCLGALFLSPLLINADLRWLAQPAGALVILHLGLMATALAYILFGEGLKRVALASAVTLSLAEPLTASLLGLLLLREKVSAQGVLGMALIFAGLAVLALRRPLRQQPLPAQGGR